MEKSDYPLEYGEKVIEQGVWADGHALMTCGGMTGHFVRPIAFCDSPAVAEAIANALKAQQNTREAA